MASSFEQDLKSVSIRRGNGKEEIHKIFVSTFLGFGANQARVRYLQKYTNPSQSQWSDPCLTKGLNIVAGNLVVNGTGNFEDCFSKVTPLLNMDMACNRNPCLMNGVAAPIEDFNNHRFIGVSELWYTTSRAYDLGGAYRYTELLAATRNLCQKNWTDITNRVEEKMLPNIDSLSRMEMHCFKSVYLLNVLHEGFGIPKETATKLDSPLLDTIDTLAGFDVSWTLGAMMMFASSTIPQHSYSDDSSVITTGEFILLLIVLTCMGLMWLFYSRIIMKKEGNYIQMTDFHNQSLSPTQRWNNV